MTQRIFDIENEKDMADLWNILPDDIVRIRKSTYTNRSDLPVNNYDLEMVMNYYITGMLQINWHDETEITRPIQEATEQDIGKLCAFWDYKEEIHYGRFDGIINQGTMTVYSLENRTDYRHARRLTKQEIEELC